MLVTPAVHRLVSAPLNSGAPPRSPWRWALRKLGLLVIVRGDMSASHYGQVQAPETPPGSRLELSGPCLTPALSAQTSMWMTEYPPMAELLALPTAALFGRWR